MKRIIRRYRRAAKHLALVDSFLLDNDQDYKRNESKLTALGSDYLAFCRELYFGGSKSRGDNRGSRQMLLSDIVQYIITSRGLYFARQDDQHRKKFIEIVMRLLNQWLIMDSFGPKESIAQRKQLMKNLKDSIGKSFFEGGDDYHIDRFEEMFNYNDDLIPKPPNPNPPSDAVLEAYDSLFPKIRGGPIELLVYLYLFQRRLGFVVSLLTQQLLFNGNRKARALPDLLLLRTKGEVIGLEIGRGKEKQSADFSLLTAVPTFSVDLVERQPFRCDGCGKWITYCDRVIELYAKDGVPKDHNYSIDCVDCPYFDSGNCRDITYYGDELKNRYGVERVARYHFRCIDEPRKKRP